MAFDGDGCGIAGKNFDHIACAISLCETSSPQDTPSSPIYLVFIFRSLRYEVS